MTFAKVHLPQGTTVEDLEQHERYRRRTTPRDSGLPGTGRPTLDRLAKRYMRAGYARDFDEAMDMAQDRCREYGE